MPQPPRVARMDDLPALRVLGGALTWRPVRRELGVRAFGVNAYAAARAGDLLIEEHTEESYLHEELYVVAAGTSEPSGWEESFAAEAMTAAGDLSGAVELLARAVEARPADADLVFNLACAETLAGRRELALDHLRRAVELDPRARRWAATETALDALRGEPDFPGDA